MGESQATVPTVLSIEQGGNDRSFYSGKFLLASSLRLEPKAAPAMQGVSSSLNFSDKRVLRATLAQAVDVQEMQLILDVCAAHTSAPRRLDRWLELLRQRRRHARPRRRLHDASSDHVDQCFRVLASGRASYSHALTRLRQMKPADIDASYVLQLGSPARFSVVAVGDVVCPCTARNGRARHCSAEPCKLCQIGSVGGASGICRPCDDGSAPSGDSCVPCRNDSVGARGVCEKCENGRVPNAARKVCIADGRVQFTEPDGSSVQFTEVFLLFVACAFGILLMAMSAGLCYWFFWRQPRQRAAQAKAQIDLAEIIGEAVAHHVAMSNNGTPTGSPREGAFSPNVTLPAATGVWDESDPSVDALPGFEPRNSGRPIQDDSGRMSPSACGSPSSSPKAVPWTPSWTPNRKSCRMAAPMPPPSTPASSPSQTAILGHGDAYASLRRQLSSAPTAGLEDEEVDGGWALDPAAVVTQRCLFAREYTEPDTSTSVAKTPCSMKTSAWVCD